MTSNSILSQQEENALARINAANERIAGRVGLTATEMQTNRRRRTNAQKEGWVNNLEGMAKFAEAVAERLDPGGRVMTDEVAAEMEGIELTEDGMINYAAQDREWILARAERTGLDFPAYGINRSSSKADLVGALQARDAGRSSFRAGSSPETPAESTGGGGGFSGGSGGGEDVRGVGIPNEATSDAEAVDTGTASRSSKSGRSSKSSSGGDSDS